VQVISSSHDPYLTQGTDENSVEVSGLHSEEDTRPRASRRCDGLVIPIVDGSQCVTGRFVLTSLRGYLKSVTDESGIRNASFRLELAQDSNNGPEVSPLGAMKLVSG
jgi:hypothetical protein